MRTLSALCLFCALAVGCSEKGPAPESENGPAGEVLEAEGKVTAIRSADGASARELSKGDTIYGDDTVETGPAASVRIRLEHNGAIWSLGEKARREVRASVAWTAPKASSKEDLLGRQDEERTAAAGRHAEGEAGETGATALREESSESAAPAPAEPAKAEDAPAAKPPSRAKRERRNRRTGAKKSGSRSTKGSLELDRLGSESARVGGARSADAEGGGGGGDGRGGKLRAEKKDTSRGLAQNSEAVIARVLRRCFERHDDAPEGTVKISLAIGKEGKVEGRLGLSTSEPGLDEVLSCARARLKKKSFSEAGRITTRVKLER